MLFLVWGLLSLAIIFSIDLVSVEFGRRGWQRFASTFLLSYFQVVIVEFLLGLANILTGPTVIAVNALIAVGLFWYVLHHSAKAVLSKYWAGWRSSIRAVLGDIKGDTGYITLLILAGAMVAWIVALGLLFPVTDVDGNSYHLTFVAQSMQNHNIYDVPTSLTWLAGYPKGGELMEMWSIITTHSDWLADLSQLPFLFLGIYALYEICLQLGSSKKAARFGALLYLFIPVVINQLKTTYVDIFLCSLFFAAIALTIRKKIATLDYLLIGITYGLLLAVKSTGLLFILATIPFLLVDVFTIRNARLHLQANDLAKKLIFLIVPVLFGLYWYVKDYIIYGSPLYPFGLVVGGKHIFPGETFQQFVATGFSDSYLLPKGMLQRIWFTWTEQQSWFGCLYGYDSTFSGLGPVWFVLLFPAAVVGTLAAIMRRNWRFIGMTALLGIIFLIYPANYYARYTLFILAIGISGFGLLITHSGPKLATFARVTAIFLAVVVMGTTFTLCNFTPDVIASQLHADRSGNPRTGAAYQNTIGGAFLYLQNRVRPGEVVAYDSRPYYIYPLWNRSYTDKVIYIPAISKGQWYTAIAKDHVRYIFANITSKERAWIVSDNKYKRILQADPYEIYQVY